MCYQYVGANVSILSMNPARLEAAKQKLEVRIISYSSAFFYTKFSKALKINAQQKVAAFPADVRDETQVNQAVTAAISKILFNIWYLAKVFFYQICLGLLSWLCLVRVWLSQDTLLILQG